MVATDLQWLVFNDFTPGIHDKLNYQGGIGGPYPLGAATRDLTYRCIGGPKGGLFPLPKRTGAVNRAAIDVNANVTDPVGQFHITGFYTGGPVLPQTGASDTEGEMYFSYEYIYNNAGTPQRRYRLERFRGFGDGVFTSLKSINSAEVAPGSYYRPTTFGTTRSLRSAPTSPGIPVVVAAWYAGGGGSEKFVSEYPNDATPTLDAMFDISTTIAGEVLPHQGRVLIFRRTDYSHGVNAIFTCNEDIFYTPVNDVGSVSALPAVFVPEDPDGYGTWSSMSANELFLVKFAGGGLTVNGDIADPTVVKLPNVVGTGAYGNLGCHSPIGFVYGVTDGGAWAWQGGDSCEYLSPQLEGNFWHIDEVVVKYRGTNRGQWARWAEWICGPKNWLYDIPTKSWWRLDNADDFQMWNMQVNVYGTEMWGAVSKYTDITTPLAHGFHRNIAAVSYSWKSHPIAKTMDRQVNIRELVLVAQGPGTVTVTLQGRDNDTRVEVFTVPVGGTNYPVTLRKNTQLFASHITVRIQSDGGAAAAPVVYELRLGLDEKMREAISA